MSLMRFRRSLFLILLPAAYLLAAGTLRVPAFWMFLSCMFIATPIMLRVADPELIKERLSPAPGGVDRHIRAKIMPFFMAHLVVAGLDARFRWTNPALPMNAVGFLALIAATSLSLWAVSVNRFFSPVVRIQTERGHHLVDRGPYHFIRHPGYLAALVLMIGSGMALGSWWSLIPNLGAMIVILCRASLEDGYLHEHLDGYRQYAARVRWRLMPGLW